MKQLVLIRHAKSSWKDESLPDIERPLNPRGRVNAPMMAARLRARGVGLERLFCSPAKRARRTAELMLAELGGDPERIEAVPCLYTFNYEELLGWLRSLDRDMARVAMVCHNPAITDLVNFLALAHLENIPTCGVATLQMKLVDWRDVGAGMAVLTDYDYPKQDPDSGGLSAALARG